MSSYHADFTVRVRFENKPADAVIKAIADRLALAAIPNHKTGSVWVYDQTETFRSVWFAPDSEHERAQSFTYHTENE